MQATGWIEFPGKNLKKRLWGKLWEWLCRPCTQWQAEVSTQRGGADTNLSEGRPQTTIQHARCWEIQQDRSLSQSSGVNIITCQLWSEMSEGDALRKIWVKPICMHAFNTPDLWLLNSCDLSQNLGHNLAQNVVSCN